MSEQQLDLAIDALKPINDPDLYARMCQPREVADAVVAHEAFFKEVSAAREKFQVRDLVMVSTMAIKWDGEKAGRAMMFVSTRGDGRLVPGLLARALHNVQGGDERYEATAIGAAILALSQLAASARQGAETEGEETRPQMVALAERFERIGADLQGLKDVL